MRGGLEDALDRLARRDQLRRRSVGEANGTPPAVTELVEAIAGVVARNPDLAVTVGVEGAGAPVLLHFVVEDGIVQVNADKSVGDRVTEAAPTSPRHADFEIDDAEPVTPPHGYSFGHSADSGQDTRRLSYSMLEDNYPQYDRPVERHPFAATPPPEVPPQTPRPSHIDQHRRNEPHYLDEPHRSAEQQHVTEEPRPAERAGNQGPPQRGMPAPLPEPIPLRVDHEETEMAARRLSALLRDNPTLLRSPD